MVGSGPGVLSNPPGAVDAHDVVLRVNNYRTGNEAGRRTDVFYSFFGSSIRKGQHELNNDGVKLCMCKCPDAEVMKSHWHHINGKTHGVDFRYIYRTRKTWWFCDTYVPSIDEFMIGFNLLGRHMPTTGFSAILDVLSFAPSHLYLTGFDFFRSGRHNVNDAWHHKNSGDPIGHVPEKELAWLAMHVHEYPIALDSVLASLIDGVNRVSRA